MSSGGPLSLQRAGARVVLVVPAARCATRARGETSVEAGASGRHVSCPPRAPALGGRQGATGRRSTPRVRSACGRDRAPMSPEQLAQERRRGRFAAAAAFGSAASLFAGGALGPASTRTLRTTSRRACGYFDRTAARPRLVDLPGPRDAAPDGGRGPPLPGVKDRNPTSRSCWRWASTARRRSRRAPGAAR